MTCKVYWTSRTCEIVFAFHSSRSLIRPRRFHHCMYCQGNKVVTRTYIDQSPTLIQLSVTKCISQSIWYWNSTRKRRVGEGILTAESISLIWSYFTYQGAILFIFASSIRINIFLMKLPTVENRRKQLLQLYSILSDQKLYFGTFLCTYLQVYILTDL